MTISWDENQLPALSSWIEEALPLKEGKILVSSMDMPPNTFAGQVALKSHEFTVYTSLDSPLVDTIVNVFLAYIVTMAYEKAEWKNTPTFDELVDCHRSVCQALLNFNEDFSKVLEEHFPVLEAWHETHEEADVSTIAVDTGDLVDTMSGNLFSANPVDSKDYGAN